MNWYKLILANNTRPRALVQGTAINGAGLGDAKTSWVRDNGWKYHDRKRDMIYSGTLIPHPLPLFTATLDYERFFLPLRKRQARGNAETRKNRLTWRLVGKMEARASRFRLAADFSRNFFFHAWFQYNYRACECPVNM